MIGRRGFLGGMVALSALSACHPPAPRYPAYRYRLTLEIDTPEGVKTGSSVIEVQTYQASMNAFPSPGFMTTRLTGEAVAVDLPGGHTVFALLRSMERESWASGITYGGNPKVPYVEGENKFKRSFDVMLQQRQLKVIPPDIYPAFVRFRDIANPRTVEAIDPDAFERTFGDGVRVRRMTVQLTDDPVTTGILNRVGWLENHGGTFDPTGTGELHP